ncbi:acyltransferase family protein [Williamsia sp. M5A3_1d]
MTANTPHRPGHLPVIPAAAISGTPVTATVAPRRRGRIKGLDGPRGIACIAVLVVHVAAHYSPDTTVASKIGLLGQSLIFFFALSGFLLFLPFVRALFLGAPKQPDVRQYFTHRLLRIFPVYIVIFLIANFALQAAYLTNAEKSLVVGSQSGTGMITDPLTFIANLFLVQTYFPSLIQTGVNPSWSLTLEYAFYVALPIVGGLMFYLRRRMRWSPVVIGMIPAVLFVVIGVAGKVFAYYLSSRAGITDVAEQNFGPNWSAVVLRSFLGGSDAFAFGMAAATIFVAVEVGAEGSTLGRRLRKWSVVGLVIATFAMLALLVLQSNFQVTATGLAAGLFILIIVLPLAEGRRSRMADILDWKPFEYLGKISLGIYLWHFPLLIALGKWGLLGGDDMVSMIRNIVTVGVVSVACAAVTYRFVEEPGLKYARKLRIR